MNILKRIFFIVLVLSGSALTAQSDRFTDIETQLKEIAKTTPGLNEKVELSLNGVAIQQFVQGLAMSNNLNVSVDGGLNTKIINNFSNVTVSDVLLFLCKKYDLDMTFIGNIISIGPHVIPDAPPSKYVAKQLKISYDKSGALSLDLMNDSLVSVAKEITKVSQKNVVFSPELAGKMVSGFIQNVPFASALDKFAFANDLKVIPTNDNFFLIEKLYPSNDNGNGKSNGGGRSDNTSSGRSQASGMNLKVDGGNRITLVANNTPIADLFSAVTDQMKVAYFLFSDLKGNATLNITAATYDEFLGNLFNGTEYTFKKDSGVYLVGDRGMEGLRVARMIPLKYRTVDKVIDYIPTDLKKGVEIKTFTDQNSLIVCGSKPRIDEIESFLRDIDRIVPVISIEVMIVDINNSHTVSTGIKAGLGDKPVTTNGEVFPSLDLSIGSGAINSIIDGINGFGVVNLGKVTPNFYITMQLLETNGDVNIKSTPLLATLNGNEATMDVGETRFYEENNTNTITTQSTTTVQSKIYKPLAAEFSLKINPIVSGDGQITLYISVKQSSFTNQSAGKGSPFNTSSRDFQSLIRVKDQEMIMLGGLDNDTKNESSSGVPVLSRIPVIKWFFSSRTKSKAKSKLTIFIKPTVIN